MEVGARQPADVVGDESCSRPRRRTLDAALDCMQVRCKRRTFQLRSTVTVI